MNTRDILNAAIGETLRRAREGRHLSLRDAAEALGMSYVKLHRYEAGTSTVPAWFLLKASHAYGTTITKLLEG